MSTTNPNLMEVLAQQLRSVAEKTFLGGGGAQIFPKKKKFLKS